jgi:GntR family transcriptional regulator
MTEDSKIAFLARALREQITRGEFGTKGRLPSVTQLAKSHQVARSTVYQALLLVQAEGLVIVKDNSHYVTYPLMRLPGAPLFDKYLEGQGVTAATDTLVAPEIIQLPKDIAEMFGQQEGLHVVHRTRRQGTTELPLRLQESFYPADLASRYLEAMKQNPDLNVAGEMRKNQGIAIAKRHDDVLARLPSPDEMKLLNIVRTTPVLEIRRHFVTQDEKTVFFAKICLVAAYFLLSYDSTTDGGRA